MMIIGYVATDFPVMTETFIRREAAAIAASGHTDIVLADRVWPASEFTELGCPTLSIREVPFVSDASALTAAAREAGVEHLHGCLTTASHKAAHLAASRLRIPFTIRVYSGYDIFTSRDTALYRGIADSEWCGGVIAEDQFMKNWLSANLAIPADKIEMIANSLDLSLYRRSHAAALCKETVILSIGRFVEKKGLIHLINSFNELSRRYSDVRLRLVGSGPHEPSLRSAAGTNPRI